MKHILYSTDLFLFNTRFSNSLSAICVCLMFIVMPVLAGSGMLSHMNSSFRSGDVKMLEVSSNWVWMYCISTSTFAFCLWSIVCLDLHPYIYSTVLISKVTMRSYNVHTTLTVTDKSPAWPVKSGLWLGKCCCSHSCNSECGPHPYTTHAVTCQSDVAALFVHWWYHPMQWSHA